MDLPALPGYLLELSLPGALSTLITVLLPLLAGLLSKQSWPASVKGVILLFLSAVKVAVETILQNMNAGADLDVLAVVYSVLINFIIAVAMYFGVLRGSGVQRAAITSGVRDP